MGTSSPSWAHLLLHGHIFIHGHIFPFMGTYCPSWAHLPLHGHIFPFGLGKTFAKDLAKGFTKRLMFSVLQQYTFVNLA